MSGTPLPKRTPKGRDGRSVALWLARSTPIGFTCGPMSKDGSVERTIAVYYLGLPVVARVVGAPRHDVRGPRAVGPAIPEHPGTYTMKRVEAVVKTVLGMEEV